MDAISNVDQLLHAWNEFVGTQKVPLSIDRLILGSWKRCWGVLNPYSKSKLNSLNPSHFLAAQVSSFDLISVARPIMEDIYQYIEGTGVSVALVNSAGCILDLIGDSDMLHYLEECGIIPSVFLSESQAGTNAFALALMERVPAQVVAAEHYLQQFQGLADASTPVFDLSGRPQGAFGLFTFAEHYRPPILSLSVAGARAIEGEHKSDQLLAEQNRQLAGLNAVLNSISQGVLVWNSDRILLHVNEAASKIINLPVQSLVGHRMGELISYPEIIRLAIDKKEPVTDVEADIKIGDRVYPCVLSLRFVENQKGLQWIIASFRLGKDLTRLVQRQFGARTTYHIADIAGETAAMRKVRHLATSAAAARARILIRGENGTGKTILASAIHNESPNREGPFLIFSCASVPTEALLTELYGYEAAVSGNRPGGRLSKFELAQGGTLYLQEIDNLTLEAQAILLNVLEIGIVHRFGSDRPIPVDTRIIASSSANLEKLIAEGSFRADLYYRISPFEIYLPPLRERGNDIPLLADRFLSRISQQIGRQLYLAPEVKDLLKKYPWPGNLRELDAVMSRAVGQAGESEMILAEHLPHFILKPVKFLNAEQGPVEVRSLEEIEGKIFLQTANLCQGNISEMARLLGIGRTTVWRKLKDYHIPIDEFRQGPSEVN